MTGIIDIVGFNFGFKLGQPAFNLQSGWNPILQQYNFSNVQNVQMNEGAYTPNNDFLYLFKDIPAAQAPNFIFLMTPTGLNLSVYANGQLITNAVPVNKMFVLLLPVGGPPVSEIYIEGRTNQGILPMVQGVPVNYYSVMAQATF